MAGRRRAGEWRRRTAHYGSAGSINVNSGSGERRAYVKFNLTNIPTGAIDITATLKLYSQSSASASVTFTVSKVVTTWTEGTLTWSNQPAIGVSVTTKAGLTNGRTAP